MIRYNPQVEDMRGQYAMQAAQANAQMMQGLRQDIGGALASIGGMYGEIEGNKAKGRAFKDVFKVIAPSAGIDMKQLEALTGGSLKNDMDWFNVSQSFGPLLPSLINAQLGGQRLGVQQGAPAATAGIKNATNIAGQGGPGIPRVNLPPASAIFGGGN
jgi:hypothetical protein